MHRRGGFPEGNLGFAMVLVWGFIQGLMLMKNQGILLVLLVHFFADFTIGVLIMREQRRINEKEE